MNFQLPITNLPNVMDLPMKLEFQRKVAAPPAETDGLIPSLSSIPIKTSKRKNL